ncbi:unnamed protein product [Prorocentrum cordatum]|uniref:Uncharacterized protein n=1 Tax=Prorocentrum cordatum TaxID=2364126 RepID=A0ABN9X0U2_9DINO|nr:unnamed protein product [Polarella glacialis]
MVCLFKTPEIKEVMAQSATQWDDDRVETTPGQKNKQEFPSRPPGLDRKYTWVLTRAMGARESEKKEAGEQEGAEICKSLMQIPVYRARSDRRSVQTAFGYTDRGKDLDM